MEEERKVEWRDVKRVLRHMLRMRGLYAVSFSLLFLMTAMTTLKAWIIMPAVNSLVRNEVTREGLYQLTGIVAAIFFLGPTLNYVYSVTNKVVAGRVTMNIRREIFDHMLGQPLGFFSGRHSTDLSSRVVNDIAQFEFSTITMVQMFARDIMAAAMLIGLMFYLSWELALVCMISGACIGASLFYLNRLIVPMSQNAQHQLGAVASHVTELITGMELVVSFGMNRTWVERFRHINQEHFDASYELEKTRAKAVWVTHTLAGVGVVIILFMTGMMILSGRVDAGRGVTIIAVMYLLQSPLASFGNQVTMIGRGMGAASRAFELLDIEPDVDDPVDPVPFPRRLDIEFESVDFAYHGKKEVLHDVSFKVEQGQSLAVVGESGAGKSTVARLLLRFYDPTRGRVLLGGVPLDRLDRHTLYETMSYVPQDSFLFDATLRENLTIGRADATDEEIRDVIHRACLDEYVARLSHGIDTQVGERGLSLSGGERQRVAIARALLRRPRVMVLDEATSAMDVELEEEILKELVGVRGMTVVAITHRPRMAQVADRVLRLDRGRVQHEGGPVGV